MNSQVSSIHKGMPSHLKVGAVLASVNGKSVLGWAHADVVKLLKQGERPLAIQFVDNQYVDMPPSQLEEELEEQEIQEQLCRQEQKS